jgi:hypothetical protein
MNGGVFVVVRMPDGRTAEWRVDRTGLRWLADLPFILTLTTPRHADNKKKWDGVLECDDVLIPQGEWARINDALECLASAEEHANDHRLWSWDSKHKKFIPHKNKSRTWGRPRWRKK